VTWGDVRREMYEENRMQNEDKLSPGEERKSWGGFSPTKSDVCFSPGPRSDGDGYWDPRAAKESPRRIGIFSIL
jgi:hypothetical protein